MSDYRLGKPIDGDLSVLLGVDLHLSLGDGFTRRLRARIRQSPWRDCRGDIGDRTWVSLVYSHYYSLRRVLDERLQTR